MNPKTSLLIIILWFPLNHFAQNSDRSNKDYETFDSYYAEADSLRRSGFAEKSTGLLYKLLLQMEANEREESAYYTRLGYLYQDLCYAYSYRNDSLCLLYADKAIDATKKAQDTIQIAQSYFAKYTGMYEIPDQAEALNEVANECVYYAEQTGHPRLKMEAYINKSDALIELGNMEEGYDYLVKAEESLNQTESELSVLFGHSMVGNLYNKLGEYEKAIEHHEFALRKTREYGFKDESLRLARNLADDYYYSGDYKSAAEFALIFGDSTELFYEDLLSEEFANNESSYKALNKDKEIAEQQLAISQSESKRYQFIIIGSVLLALVLIGFQWLLFRQRKRKQQVEMKLKKERELNDLRSTFLENIAHEIRTPITLINGHLDLALEKNENQSDQTKHIRLAKSNSSQILSNANELLELMKLDRGKLPQTKEEIHLEPFLRRVFFAFESLAELKELKLNFKNEIPGNAFIQSDTRKIEKMINNYVANAIKFSPSGSEIRFESWQTENGIKFTVSDQGPGIAKVEQDKVFSRFYQSPDVVSIGGVGVGLSIVREYVEFMGGHVSVESAPGAGASFSVELPVEIYEKASETAIVENGETETHEFPNLNLEGKPNLLVVEDNPEMNGYLREILSPDFNCDIAFNGMEALQKIQVNKYALILSDVMMPQMDGIELKQKINALPNRKNLPFIFITAKAQLSDKITGFGLGVDDYIVKPFVKEELLARIFNLLSTKQERERWLKENLEFLDEKGNAEEKLLEKIKSLVLSNLDNTEFKVADLASEIGYSQRQLSRFLNKTIGLSPVQYVLEVRLKKAHLYLTERKFATLGEVRNSVGISSASYFNKKFFERFGVKPTDVTT